MAHASNSLPMFFLGSREANARTYPRPRSRTEIGRNAGDTPPGTTLILSDVTTPWRVNSSRENALSVTMRMTR